MCGDKADAHAYAFDPDKPIKSLKEAWERAKKVAGVVCRFHDLRHTAATRMLEGGSPLMVVASILGWSASTAARMAKRYGHIGNEAQTKAVTMLMVDRVVGSSDPRGHKKGHSGGAPSLSKHRKLLKLSGSSGWTRTSNPPVNSEMSGVLPQRAWACGVLPIVAELIQAQRLTSCRLMLRDADSCSELRPPNGTKTAQELLTVSRSAYCNSLLPQSLQ